MKTDVAGLAFITAQEGCVLHVYDDISGNPTIGVGHELKPGESFPNGITQAQAEALLAQDVASCEVAINEYVTAKLTQAAFNALVDFAFNLGNGALESSTLLKLLNQGNYTAAADEFPKWCHAVVDGKYVEVPALLARRNAERTMFLSTSVVINAPTSDPTVVPVTPVSPVPIAPSPVTPTPSQRPSFIQALVTFFHNLFKGNAT